MSSSTPKECNFNGEIFAHLPTLPYPGRMLYVKKGNEKQDKLESTQMYKPALTFEAEKVNWFDVNCVN